MYLSPQRKVDAPPHWAVRWPQGSFIIYNPWATWGHSPWKVTTSQGNETNGFTNMAFWLPENVQSSPHWQQMVHLGGLSFQGTPSRSAWLLLLPTPHHLSVWFIPPPAISHPSYFPPIEVTHPPLWFSSLSCRDPPMWGRKTSSLALWFLLYLLSSFSGDGPDILGPTLKVGK